VHTSLAVITGAEDRQHAYVALTRGADTNTAYVFTTSPKSADPAPGPRSAPELARYDQIQAERAGDPAPATPPAPPGAALGVLFAILGRDGQQHSATQTSSSRTVTKVVSSKPCMNRPIERPPLPQRSSTQARRHG
jgi:hypothetical protein